MADEMTMMWEEVADIGDLLHELKEKKSKNKKSVNK